LGRRERERERDRERERERKGEVFLLGWCSSLTMEEDRKLVKTEEKKSLARGSK